MAFVVKALFVSALVYGANAGFLSGEHSSSFGNSGSDSFLSSALQSSSASFGPPSQAYGPPAPPPQIHQDHGREEVVEQSVVEDHGPALSGASLPGIGGIAAASISQDSNIAGPNHFDSGAIGSVSGPERIPSGPSPVYGVPSGSGFGPISSGPGPLASGPAGDLSGPAPSGNGYSDGSLLLDSNLPGASGQIIGNTATVGAPRVIGTSVSVGRPSASATRYELQSVVQNVVRRIPIEVTRHIQVAVPHPVPVPVRQEVKVPVPQPYPVHVDVVKHVPYPVYKTEHVPVERPVPYEVVRQVPVEVIRKVHVPVERPYEVIKKIHVPVEKRVEVPVAVWKPYPLHIIKHVTHYKKKHCCW